MNRQAQAMIAQRDGLRIQHEMLSAALPNDAVHLQNLIQAATASPGKGMRSGGVVRVRRPSQRRSFEILVAPLRAGSSWLASENAAAVIFLTDPEAKTENSTKTLIQMFGLTPAEASLAGKLMQGMSLKEAADMLGVTRNTAHSQLQKIFEKTGTNRQAELMRVLLSSPARLPFG
jgi:DNA-binding CsgD family transcriptional regulator